LQISPPKKFEHPHTFGANQAHLVYNYRVKKEELIKKFGTSGINYYVHIECVNTFVKKLPTESKVIETIWFLKPDELIGVYDDINECDACKNKFLLSDLAYLGIRLTTLSEISLLTKTHGN
jgi:hypothetical protein